MTHRTVENLLYLVKESHDEHFHHTNLPERLRDIANEIHELVNYRDEANLREELGDSLYSLLQLCNEKKLDPITLVEETVEKLNRRGAGQRVALIGTSANPITNAHLTMALEILALTGVDKVWFYLVGEHPWGKTLMPAHHRLEMVRRAVAKYPKLHACDYEMVHGKSIYSEHRETADILRYHFMPAHPNYRFSWVMGSDVAQTFHKWSGAAWMAEHLDVTVIHRLGYDFDKENSLLSNPRHVYLRENIVTSNISSTLVRERGKKFDAEKLVALVPDVVSQYLEEHKLLE